jgi:Transposase DDE domain
MSTKTNKDRHRHARELADAIDQFLTPALLRQAYKAFRSSRRTPKPPSQRPHNRNRPPRRAAQRPNRRWDLKPLIVVLVSLTWCGDQMLEERFQTACDFANAARPKRRRVGGTFAGFQMALGRLRMTVLAILARGIRDQFLKQMGPALLEHGFVPIGCDGSRLECPRTDELLRHLDPAGKADSAPTLWVTALVHLTTGVPWYWRVDAGTASERHHLIEMIDELPAAALVICDAGYYGFELASALTREHSFLIRLSSKVRLLSEDHVEMASYREGLVYYWPNAVQKNGGPPLLVRMIRVAGKVPEKDVWLLTNVLDPERLSVEQASRFYKMRWENEGMFRTYKRTINKVKLVSRTLRAVRREAYGSLLATQLLLGSGALALHQKRCREAASGSGRKPVVSTPSSTRKKWSRAAASGSGRKPAVSTPCSARKVLTAFRACMNACRQVDRTPLPQRLEQSERERRERKTAKQKREFPRRKPHEAPKPPKVLTMTEEQKSLLAKHKSDSEAA